MPDIVCVLEAHSELGEGTLWDPAAGVLWWVDIWGKAIHRFDPVTRQRRGLRRAEICRLRRAAREGRARRHARRRLLFLRSRDGRRSSSSSTPRRTGRTRASTTASPTARAASGRAPCSRIRRGRPNSSGHSTGSIRTSPATGWSRASARRTASPSAPTAAPVLRRQPGRLRLGVGLRPRDRRHRPTAGCSSTTRDTGGCADGATVDAEGCYWTTLPESGKLSRYDPDGRLMRTIMMPTGIPTCCEFGGKDLDILYVTTARLRKLTDPLRRQRSSRSTSA